MKVQLLRTSGGAIEPQLVKGFEKALYTNNYTGDKDETELLDFIFTLNAVYNCEVIVEKTINRDGSDFVCIEVYDDYRE